MRLGPGRGRGGKINKYQPRAEHDEVTGGAGAGGGDPGQASHWSEPLVPVCYWSMRGQQSVQCYYDGECLQYAAEEYPLNQHCKSIFSASV